jgi:murein L,D-transpeptidase YcbB/YkuD
LAPIGPLAVGAMALLAACAPAEPPVTLAADEQPAVALVSAPSAARVTGALTTPADTRLGELIENAPGWVVAGERLNVELLRRFYARHGFAPVWTNRQSQAEALMEAVSRAGEHGLAPELFHTDVLRSPATLPALDRELLLSNAVLSYADALARGVMPAERRKEDQVLEPEPIDVAVVLDAALASPDPASVIEALAPVTPTYRVLRNDLQELRAGSAARGKADATRVRALEVNLERERWLPRRLPPDRVWVNVADGQLMLYRDDQPVFTTRVIVGQDDSRNQSPEFQASIEGLWFNPPWNIPSDIATQEILPKASRDPTYLAKRNMVLLPDGGLQQAAGANSGLGQLMFYMNNRFDVYLHDTPSKNLFSRDDRRISHGCIRVEDPRKLAALLMQQPVDAIDQAIATGTTTWGALPKPVPVFVVYETAFADVEGKPQFRADIYGRDAEIWQSLEPKRRERRLVAERAAPGQRLR